MVVTGKLAGKVFSVFCFSKRKILGREEKSHIFHQFSTLCFMPLGEDSIEVAKHIDSSR